MKKISLLMCAVMACFLMCAGWCPAQEANQLQLPDDVFFIAKAKSIDHLQSQIEELLQLVGQPTLAPVVKQGFAEAFGVNALDSIDGTKEMVAIMINPLKYQNAPIVLIGGVKNKQKYIEALQANNEMAIENNVYRLTAKSGGESFVLIKDTMLFYGKSQDALKKISEWPNLNNELASIKLKGDAGINVFVPRINAALSFLLNAQIAQVNNQLKQMDQPADPDDQMAQFREMQKGFLTIQQQALNFSANFLKETKLLNVDLDLGKEKQVLDIEYEAVANGNFSKEIAKNQLAPTSMLKYFPQNTCVAASGYINPETQSAFLKWYANFVSMIPTPGQKEADKKMLQDILSFTVAQSEFLGGESGGGAFSNDKGEGLSFLAVYELKNPELAKKSIDSLKATLLQMVKEKKDMQMDMKTESDLSDPSGLKYDKYTLTPAKNENFEKNMATYAKVCKNLLNSDKLEVYTIINNKHMYVAIGGKDAFIGAKAVIDNIAKKQPVLGKDPKFTNVMAQLHPNANVYYFISVADFMKPISKVAFAMAGETLPKFNEQSPAVGISILCEAAKVKMRVLLPGQTLKDIADAIMSAEQDRQHKAQDMEDEAE